MRALCLCAALSILGACGTADHGTDEAPSVGASSAELHASSLQIEQAMAVATLQLTSMDVGTCDGVDGTNSVIRLTAVGPIVSPDPRLNGTFHANARLLHRPDGRGVSEDNFEVYDDDGRLIMKGQAHAADPVAGPTPIKGLALARLSDGSRFVAGSTVTLPAPGTNDPLVIEYGVANPGVQDEAVLVTGDCAEYFDDWGEYDDNPFKRRRR